MEDLEARKLYQVLPDREANREDYVRIIDESARNHMYSFQARTPFDSASGIALEFIIDGTTGRQATSPCPLKGEGQSADR